MYRNILIGALFLLLGNSALAIELFETNPSVLYPPGCISTTLDGLTSPTGSQQIYAKDIVAFSDAENPGSTVNVEVMISRRGCKEDNRSVLYMSFTLLSANKTFNLPRINAQIGQDEVPLRLVSEPNTFEDDMTGKTLPAGTFEFIVDGQAESTIGPNTTLMLPSRYSSAFLLEFVDFQDDTLEYSVQLPDWTGSIKPFRVPLQGRLAGVWATQGAADQGFVISFNEFVTEDETLQQVFFSWYTFGSDGTMLWLTAGAFFDVGDSEVELPLELVTNGEFMGNNSADREVISTAVLRVEDCNQLLLTYDLESIGLDAAEITLTRIFSLETAGYACRDREARLETL